MLYITNVCVNSIQETSHDHFQGKYICLKHIRIPRNFSQQIAIVPITAEVRI